MFAIRLSSKAFAPVVTRQLRAAASATSVRSMSTYYLASHEYIKVSVIFFFDVCFPKVIDTDIFYYYSLNFLLCFTTSDVILFVVVIIFLLYSRSMVMLPPLVLLILRRINWVTLCTSNFQKLTTSLKGKSRSVLSSL